MKTKSLKSKSLLRICYKPILIIFGAVLMVTSCLNESVIEQKQESFRTFVFGDEAFVSNGILKFNSIDGYIDLIENENESKKDELVQRLDALKDYRSFKIIFNEGKKMQSARILSGEEEFFVETNNFFSTLINSEGIVGIGDYYFKIDLANEQCLVLHMDNLNKLEDLINSNFSNKNILVFSTSDDVLDLLAQGSKGTISGRNELFCNDRRASGKEKIKFDEYSDDVAGVDYQVKAKHVYQEAAVYFSLLTELKHMSRFQDAGPLTPWSTSNTEIYVEYYFKWKQRCISGDNLDQGSKSTDWDNKLNHRPYERSRGLAKIILRSRYIYLQRNVNTGGVDRELTITDIVDGY